MIWDVLLYLGDLIPWFMDKFRKGSWPIVSHVISESVRHHSEKGILESKGSLLTIGFGSVIYIKNKPDASHYPLNTHTHPSIVDFALFLH